MKSREFDNRPRNGEGQFAPETSDGNNPNSMAAAYGGVARKKNQQVQQLLNSLRQRKPVRPPVDPMLSSRGRRIAFSPLITEETDQYRQPIGTVSTAQNDNLVRGRMDKIQAVLDRAAVDRTKVNVSRLLRCQMPSKKQPITMNRKSIAINFALPFDQQTRHARESEVEQLRVALNEMSRRNLLRDRAGLRPLTLEEVLAGVTASRKRMTGFGALGDENQQPSPLRDATVGAAEGIGGYFLTDKIAKSLAPAGSGVLRKAGVAGVIGAGGTMLAGSLMNQIAKRRQQQQQTSPVLNQKPPYKTDANGFSSTPRLIKLASKLENQIAGAPLSGKVAHDRYVKTLRDQDIARRDEDLVHAGIAGGAAGALINRGRIAKLTPLRRAGVGALTGAAAVEGIRVITGRHRDIYGDRTAEGKAAEHLPAIAAGGTAAVLGGIAVRKAIKSKFKFSIIRSAIAEAIELSSRNQKTNNL